MDQRNSVLARNLVNYSCRLKAGEKVLVECKGLAGIPLMNEVVKEAYKVGALPFTEIYDETADRALLLGASEAQLNMLSGYHQTRMKDMDAYIGIRCAANISELSDVPADKQELYAKLYNLPVHFDIRVNKTKWVVLRYPNASMAQAAGTSMEAFKDFYYNVCNLDYQKMSDAMDALVTLMDKTDSVRLTGKGTDISFSIKGIPTKKCAGECNMPDGEVYSAPVKNSVNGVISYNTPSLNKGFVYENIVLEFKDGKIIKATANDSCRLNKELDTDEGARYVGEFAVGVNPYINHPMKDTLFDEKIAGSFHFTPGGCYEDADNGNKSAIHWDLVFIQTPEYGGGDMYFDGVLARRDGRFVLPELARLNPENLK